MRGFRPMKCMKKGWISLSSATIVLFLSFIFCKQGFGESEVASNGNDLDFGSILPELVHIGYSGKENLVYDVSWTGGIKIGELHIEIDKLTQDDFEIRVRVTTEEGALHYIYPIEDRYLTRVKGEQKLPYLYEVWQKEGYNYTAHRRTQYDQKNGRVLQHKNGKDKGVIRVDGWMNNEFSSFFNSRLMRFHIGESFLVPTFADSKRAEVVVNVVSKGVLEDSGLGDVECYEVMPVLTFKGLYDKEGDTIIWYTNDECRVPVRIQSKILIGSLTAELVEYSNPACGRYQLDEEATN